MGSSTVFTVQSANFVLIYLILSVLQFILGVIFMMSCLSHSSYVLELLSSALHPPSHRTGSFGVHIGLNEGLYEKLAGLIAAEDSLMIDFVCHYSLWLPGCYFVMHLQSPSTHRVCVDVAIGKMKIHFKFKQSVQCSLAIKLNNLQFTFTALTLIFIVNNSQTTL